MLGGMDQSTRWVLAWQQIGVAVALDIARQDFRRVVAAVDGDPPEWTELIPDFARLTAFAEYLCRARDEARLLAELLARVGAAPTVVSWYPTPDGQN